MHELPYIVIHLLRLRAVINRLPYIRFKLLMVQLCSYICMCSNDDGCVKFSLYLVDTKLQWNYCTWNIAQCSHNTSMLFLYYIYLMLTSLIPLINLKLIWIARVGILSMHFLQINLVWNASHNKQLFLWQQELYVAL